MASNVPDKGPQRVFIAYIVLTIFGIFLLNQFFYASEHWENLSYSDFLNNLQNNQLTKVTLSDGRIYGEIKAEGGKPKKEFVTIAPPEDPDLVKNLSEHKVDFSVEPKNPLWGFIASWVLPILLFYILWSFLFRRMGSGAPGNLMGFTRSRAKIFVETNTKTRFEDVADAEEAKEELKELVSFLKDPKDYSRLGGRAPKGILLVGPPGTGKTLLAKAVAGEANVPFFSINGSEFVEMFVGLGAARVRDLFEQARNKAPCIIFIDEIDALGRSRALGIMGGGGNDEKEQTVNQLLAEMDGFDSSGGVIILGATNRPEILDPALLRAGRFDRQILVNLPDKEGRRQILEVHSKKIILEPNVSFEHIASLTSGFSGADLANLVNEAAVMATRRKESAVSENDFTLAIERIIAGLEQKKKVIQPEEKRRVAYHEMGHATVALSSGVEERVHKISIIPRGLGALGYTLQRPTEDRYLMERGEMKRKIAVLMGGRASEKIFFQEVSTGAADDLAKATEIARAMVTQYGMSEKVGLATFEQRRSPFLSSNYTLSNQSPYSESTAEEIDLEVKAILDSAMEMAENIIQNNREFLELGAKRLLDVETLDETEVQRLWAMHGKKTEEEKKLKSVIGLR